MPAMSALLERERERERIEVLLAACSDGDGGLLIIEGPAGVGKTSLMELAREIAEDRGIRNLRARGGEYERDFPYGVVRQLFEPPLGDASSAELLSGSASLASPVFDARSSVGTHSDPFAIQHGLYWLVANLSERSPVLLQVDDAQWADLASLRALTYIGRRLGDLPVSLALTVRTGEPGGHDTLLDELRREPGAHSMEPQPLSMSATAALLSEQTGERSSKRLASACWEATAGNPLLLVELLRSLEQESIDPASADAEVLSEIAATGISRSILTRLARLGERSTDVARAVAVLEPNAEIRLVAALSGLPQELVTAECERLVRADLLSDSRPVGFVHPLVRAAVLGEIPKPRLAANHAQAALVLSDHGLAVDAVAAHLLLAEPAGEGWVVDVLRSAAEAAIGRGAPDAAVRYCRRALAEPPAAEDRLAVSRQLGQALLRANDPEGIDVLRTVRKATESAVERAEIATFMASSLGLRGGPEEGAALLEESLSELPDPAGELATYLRGWLLLQVTWGWERLPEGILPEPGDEPGSETLGGRLLLAGTALLLAAGVGKLGRAGELAEKALSDREAIVEDAVAGLPPQGALVALVLADRGEHAEELIDLAREGSRRRRALAAISGNHGVRAVRHLLDGDLRDAQADAEIALDLVGGLELQAPVASWCAVAIRSATARGDFAAAEELLSRSSTDQGRFSGISAALLLCARGELRRATGRHAEARHDFLAAGERIPFLPHANPELFPWRPGLALCECALGNEERARELAAEAVELAREAGGSRGIGVVLRAQGEVLRGPEGLELLRDSVDVLATSRVGLERARSLVALGAALRRANRRREAREPLREGLDLAHRCSAPALEERARTELSATGARPRRATFSGVESLTPSELRVARMATDGMTNREIAQALTVTEKTVETHMRHVFQKLDVGRRTELPAALASG